MDKKPIRISLPGGGVKGAFQAGFLIELFKSNKYKVETVYGTSSGAIMAPLVANEKWKELYEVFINIKNIGDIFKKRRFVPDILAPFFAFFKLGAFEKITLVDKVFDLLTSQETKIACNKCHVAAHDLLNNTQDYFTGDKLKEGIIASCALWLAVPPIVMNNKLYIDGGVTELFPADYIKNHELESNYDGLYLLIDCASRDNAPVSKPKNAVDLLSNLQWASTIRLSELELSKLRETLKDRFIVIRPDKDILNSPLDIDKNKMLQTYEMGVEKAKDFLLKYD